MKLVSAGSKDNPIYYVQKTVYINGKSTTKAVERLGRVDEIKKRCGDEDPIVWAKNYVKKLTDEYNDSRKAVPVTYSAGTLIEKNVQKSMNVGYFFPQYIYYSLGLNKICQKISERYDFKYDLNEILSMLVYTRILYPGSKLSSLDNADNFYNKPECKLHDIYRALEVLAKESDYIQAELFKNSEKAIQRDKRVLYYDCTNYYFEIEDEDNFRKYGYSKEHKPNPIVQMGLFIDSDGIPLAFSMFNGNANEQPTITPLESKIISEYGIDKFIVCTDAGLSSEENRKFNNKGNRAFVTTQPIKKLKVFLQNFCLGDEGWHLENSKKEYKLSELDEVKDYDKVFYKDRWINENGLEQHLIVSYSIKYKKYQQSVRERQVDRAKQLIENPSKLNKKNANDPKRFIVQDYCTNEGEIAEKASTELDTEKIAEEAKYDGFYAVCTNLENDFSTIIKINKKRWEIEECFRIMKSEFKARPVYLSREDRIRAHFLTCFIALVVYRILESKLGSKYTCEQIVKTLREMNMTICPGDGYVPSYKRTDITDALHEAFNFRTDYEITTQVRMRNIARYTKKLKKN